MCTDEIKPLYLLRLENYGNKTYTSAVPDTGAYTRKIDTRRNIRSLVLAA